MGLNLLAVIVCAQTGMFKSGQDVNATRERTIAFGFQNTGDVLQQWFKLIDHPITIFDLRSWELSYFDPWESRESQILIATPYAMPQNQFRPFLDDNRATSKKVAIQALERLIQFDRAETLTEKKLESDDSKKFPPPTFEVIMTAYVKATGTASEREKSISHLIEKSQWSSFAAVKAAANRQNITLKSLKKKISDDI